MSRVTTTSMGRRAMRSGMGRVALLMLAVIAVMAVLGATALSTPATLIDPAAANRPPSASHPFGTDPLGRDHLARVAFATPLSLLLALSATAIGITGGLVLGAAGWFTGPRLRSLIASVIGIAMAFPSLLLVLFASVIFGQTTVGSVLAVGIAQIPWFARLVQNLVQSVRTREYVLAALVQGRPRVAILFRHILPNVAEPLIINATLGAGGALLAFAGLSFLGLGLQAPEYDWGLLLNENMASIYVTPLPALAAAAMIVIAGLGFSLLGESFARSLEQRAPTVPKRTATKPSPVGGMPEGLVARVEHLDISAMSAAGPVPIVQDVSIDVPAGRIIGVVGESGSGKTITAQVLAQVADESLDVSVVRLDLDGVSYAGAEASEDPRLVRSVGYVFQDSGSSFNPVMRLDRQIPEALEVHERLGRRRARQLTVEQLDRVGVPEPAARASQYPHQFSGGMRQRAMIAQATVATPRLVIADEPTTALDVSLKARILELLRELRDRDGAAVILISHDISALLTVADDILVMRGGRIVERGTARQISERPQHPYTKALLAAVPSMDTPLDEPLATIAAEDPVTAAPAAGDPAPAPQDGARARRVRDRRRAPLRGHEQAGERMDRALGFENVTVTYGSGHNAFTAVKGVTLDVPPGSITGIVGESGSGKSTLARATVGLVPVTAGSITLGGTPLAGRDSRRAIQMVFQDPYASLDPRMTVGASIAEGLRASRRPAYDVDELLRLIGLDPARRGALPKDFSGGQRQRIALARALAAGPDVLIADEITSALDVSVQGSVINLLLDLQRRIGFSVLFISHDLPVVRYVSDRMAVMYRGEVVEAGTTAQILESPEHPYTRSLIAASAALGPAGRATVPSRNNSLPDSLLP